ncbi:MAG: hypothetical protein ACKO5K_13595, partial [Armatimonadota bacterium]
MPSLDPSRLAPPAAPDRMPETIVRYTEDRDALHRRYPNSGSPRRLDRIIAFHEEWREGLAGVGRLDTPDDRVDLELLRAAID